jgi:hypothetical protein
MPFGNPGLYGIAIEFSWIFFCVTLAPKGINSGGGLGQKSNLDPRLREGDYGTCAGVTYRKCVGNDLCKDLNRHIPYSFRTALTLDPSQVGVTELRVMTYNLQRYSFV